MNVRSAPLTDALRLYRDFQIDDPRATGEVRELFAPGDSCFLCDRPVDDDLRLLVTEDPAQPHVQAIVAPLCASCMSLPTLQRLHRVRSMLAAMFPRVRRHDVNLVSSAALRRLG